VRIWRAWRLFSKRKALARSFWLSNHAPLSYRGVQRATAHDAQGRLKWSKRNDASEQLWAQSPGNLRRAPRCRPPACVGQSRRGHDSRECSDRPFDIAEGRALQRKNSAHASNANYGRRHWPGLICRMGRPAARPSTASRRRPSRRTARHHRPHRRRRPGPFQAAASPCRPICTSAPPDLTTRRHRYANHRVWPGWIFSSICARANAPRPQLVQPEPRSARHPCSRPWRANPSIRKK
jgi:hypothetical protein